MTGSGAYGAESPRRKLLQKSSWRRWLPTALGIVLCVVLLPVLVINLLLLVDGALHPDQVPSVFSVAPVVIQSDAMQPSFGVNDLALVIRVEPSTLQEGEVIAYRMADRLLFGRITARSIGNDGGAQFFVKADSASAEAIYPVTGEQVIGRYRMRLRGMGGVALFLQSPAGIFCFLILPFLLLLGWDVLRKHLRGRKKAGDTLTDSRRRPNLDPNAGAGHTAISIGIYNLKRRTDLWKPNAIPCPVSARRFWF